MIKRFRVKEKVIIYARANMNSIVYGRKREWCKPGFIRDLTGWDGEKLRQAKEQKLITGEKRTDGWWYDANSIPERFLLKK